MHLNTQHTDDGIVLTDTDGKRVGIIKHQDDAKPWMYIHNHTGLSANFVKYFKHLEAAEYYALAMHIEDAP